MPSKLCFRANLKNIKFPRPNYQQIVPGNALLFNWCAVAGAHLRNGDVLSFCQSFEGKYWWRCIIQFLERLNNGHLRFLDSKRSLNYWKNGAHAWQFKPSDLFKAQSLIIRQEIIGNRYLKPVNFSANSTKTIRLYGLDFYEVIVDSTFGLINNHLTEISTS